MSANYPTVCVVTERDASTGRDYLFGVFKTEESARKEYGDADARHEVRFDVVRLFP
jgi:hypothetical protein